MYYIFLFLQIFLFNLPLAIAETHHAITWKVQEVLSGDTAIMTDRDSRTYLVHLAGIRAFPPSDQIHGVQAKAALSNRIQNRFVDVLVKKERGKHILAQVSYGGQDIGFQMLKSGLVFYDESDADSLRPVNRSSYQVLSDHNRASRQGVYLGGRHYTMTATDRGLLRLSEIQQPRYNGADDPKEHSFGKDEAFSEKAAPDNKGY